MFRHSLLLIYRNFKRYKGSFFINLLGLSTGLACTLLIYLWVSDELNIDKFHEKDRRLFQVMIKQKDHGSSGTLTGEGTPGLLAEALAAEIPEIEYTSAIATTPGFGGKKGILSAAGTHITAVDLYVGRDFFNIFSYKLIQGNKDQVLRDKNSVVISEELALKLFHTTENIIGKTVEWNRINLNGLYRISGIFEKSPSNSSLQFDLLFPYELYMEKYPNIHNWTYNSPSTYVVLRDGVDIDQFNHKIAGFIKSKHEKSGSTLFLERYSEKNLYQQYKNGIRAEGGRIVYVRLFSIIALFLLSIACINFMNLSTAQASRRIKEVGVKKAIGVHRKTLIFQYLGESMAITLSSLAIAVVLVALFLPQFNEITGKQLSFRFDVNLIVPVFIITFFTGLISGSYPALYLSNFSPVTILKGRINTSLGELWTRKGLVVFQFVISVILIVSVLVVYKQITFIQTKNLGYETDNIVYFRKDGKLGDDIRAFFEEGGKLEKEIETFLQAVKNIPGVVNASNLGYDVSGPNGFSGLSWEGKNPDQHIQFGLLEVGYDLIETLGIEMVAGRTFSRDFGSEMSKIIMNEAAIESMGLTDPIGKAVRLWGMDHQIIGVTKNFHFESLHEKVKPCFFRLIPMQQNIVVKIKAGTEKETLKRLQEFYGKSHLGLPFDYKFLDDDYQALYTSENRVAVLSKYFAGMAILISCLGLFGLAAFTAERRLKEIGIRKILGSSAWGITYLLSRDFTKIVLAAIAISLPISYLLAKNWLEGFAYRIDLNGWFFTGAGLLVLFIAWLTVGLQTVKAAHINPVQCLRDE